MEKGLGQIERVPPAMRHVQARNIDTLALLFPLRFFVCDTQLWVKSVQSCIACSCAYVGGRDERRRALHIVASVFVLGRKMFPFLFASSENTFPQHPRRALMGMFRVSRQMIMTCTGIRSTTISRRRARRTRQRPSLGLVTGAKTATRYTSHQRDNIKRKWDITRACQP